MDLFSSRLTSPLIFRTADQLFKGNFFSHLQQLRAEQNLPQHDILSLQAKKLTRLLSCALLKSEHYRERIPALEGATVYEILSRIPILQRAEVVRFEKDFPTSNLDSLLPLHSGGTSGDQCTIWVDYNYRAMARAAQLLMWEWAGYQMGAPSIQIGAIPRDFQKRMKDIFFRTDYVFTDKLDEHADRLINAISSGRIKHLIGFPSRVVELSHQANASGINLRDKLTSVMVYGNKLFEHDRKFLENLYSTQVFETYGMSEVFPVAAQYELNSPLKIMEGHVIVEILDRAGKPVPAGKPGQLIVTVLDNLTMPLIRYNTGDMGTMIIKTDGDGFEQRYLQREIFRSYELFERKSDGQYTVHDIARQLSKARNVKFFRLMRRADQKLCLQYVPIRRAAWDADAIINDLLRPLLHEPVCTEEIRELPRTPSDKPEYMRV